MNFYRCAGCIICIFQVVESDADEELIFNIPFTANIKLKGIIVIGEDSDAHPARLRMFIVEFG